MSAQFPVINAAYERFLRNPSENYGPSIAPSDLALARESAERAKAFGPALWGANCSYLGSGTNATLDMGMALEGRPAQHASLCGWEDSYRYGQVRIANVGSGSTGAAVVRVAEENFKELSVVLDGIYAVFVTTGTGTGTGSNANVFVAPESLVETKARPLEARHPWLLTAYELVELKRTRKALKTIFAGVENCLERADMSSLNEILAGVDLSRLDPQTMTAIARVSSRARRALPAWEPLVNRIRQHLGKLAIPNVNSLLLGL